ncbi:hypothetical protein KQI82_13650 [Oscillibacter sp. MSJ-2]|uniref:Uncharacterized protein n=1 Tax=Dysosmobacter acutus TaxID=2841504 RepID=A0ABS6FCG4_9FIRM|nr:hypothetical protein [Dysosmobacter acutus]MBU5627951.1 hypothetical protein [Dysosmobacter acutus]
MEKQCGMLFSTMAVQPGRLPPAEPEASGPVLGVSGRNQDRGHRPRFHQNKEDDP